jgi:hypothetical protein
MLTVRTVMTGTWIDQNSSSYAEVHAIVLVNQSSNILTRASPDGHTAFHIISTVMQQTSQGRRVRQITAAAQRVSRCSQRVGTAHSTTSVSASQRPVSQRPSLDDATPAHS